ncbi:MAG: hypothetical protein R3C46_09190 [Hyphomonadaceae bacterium]
MSIGDLGESHIWTGDGSAAPLTQFASPRVSSGPARTGRYERERTVTITGYLQPGAISPAK